MSNSVITPEFVQALSLAEVKESVRTIIENVSPGTLDWMARSIHEYQSEKGLFLLIEGPSQREMTLIVSAMLSANTTRHPEGFYLSRIMKVYKGKCNPSIALEEIRKQLSEKGD